jgi:putrescine transport system permease protein
MSNWRGHLLTAVLLAGLAFLYAPIATLVVYSFNASPMVTIWTGISTRWYGVLAHDPEMLAAARRSVEIALLAATGATIVGTLAGYALSRFKRFRGRSLFAGMMLAPLVMPEIISGIALLLMFVGSEQAFGWPHGRGVMTITAAHITFCSAFVAIVIQSRLAGFDTSLEEAALDLGAMPATVFCLVTLPLILPAIVAAWLLAFSLSIDDVVISEFTSGPTSTTLPLVVFSRIRLGVSPEINALAAIVIFIVLGATTILTLVRARRAALSSLSETP